MLSEEEKDIIEAAAKGAAESFLKTLPIYPDLFQPAAKELGSGLKSTAKLISLPFTLSESAVTGAVDFLSTIIKTTAAETTSFLTFGLNYLKFKHQVNILCKTEEYCKQRNITIKQIPLKLISPLLDHASLEDDEFLQEKWSILLGNLLDSEQNIQSHVFPYLLSQISKEELIQLNDECELANKNRSLAKSAYADFLSVHKSEMIAIDRNILSLEQKIKDLSQTSDGEWLKNYHKKRNLQELLEKLVLKQSTLLRNTVVEAFLPPNALQEFEVANLIRLGLLKEITHTYAENQTIEIPNEKESNYLNFQLDFNLETQKELIITELGEMFIVACSEKK